MATIRSSRVVIGGELRPATIRHEDGLIVDVFDGPAEHDVGDLVLLPGLVDSHVHVNEPGRTDWEGFSTATTAAAAGGTTTIVDMPLNSKPPTTTVAALEEKRQVAEKKLAVDVAFWGGVVPGSSDEVAGLAGQGVCGFKVFMVDSGVPEFPPVELGDLKRVLETIGSAGVPALVHAESAEFLRPVTGDPRSYRSYLASRPVESEAHAVSVVAAFVEDTGVSTHVLHVSSAEAVDIIGSGPSSLSGETCPHYLAFDAGAIADRATQFKCAPPIRESEHREALWEGLRWGKLAMVVSDHSPAPPEIKELDTGDFSSAWGGVSSLEIRLPATWTEAAARGFGPVDLVEWLSAAPARLAGLDDRKGAIEVGKDADLVVWDPNGETTVHGTDLHHRHPVTPYEGMRLRGRVVETLLRGVTIFDGNVVGGRGRMLRR